MPVSNKAVEEYYDSFSSHQKKIGINIRHRTIYRNLLDGGLNSANNVLEIGCGIGTVSSLILKTVTKGVFVGVDISSESIEIARKNLSMYSNARFGVSDMSNFSSDVQFDVIVFPDVIEHIPAEQHERLFDVVGRNAAPNSAIFINIPHPRYQRWLRKYHPERMQIIDEAVDVARVAGLAANHGFEVESVKPYCLHYRPCDYLFIVLKREFTTQEYVRRSWIGRAIDNQLSKWR